MDDHPAPLSTLLPEMAASIGAPRPKETSAALARLVVGGWGVVFVNQLRGASNARARSDLGWSPRYASPIVGFRTELGSERPVALTG